MIRSRTYHRFPCHVALAMAAFLWSLSRDAQAQKTDQRIFHVVVNEDDYTRDFNVIDKEKTLFVAANRDYHWYRSNKVLTTKGGQGGRLLHGEYKEYHLNKNLRSRGRMKKGLCVGHWKEWWPNGMVMASYRYRFGMKHGKQFNYDQEGYLIEINRYRRGWKQGWTSYFSEGKKTAKDRYEHGRLVRSKNLIETPEAPPSAAPSNVAPEPMGTAEKPAKERKRLKALSRKNREPIPEATPETRPADDH